MDTPTVADVECLVMWPPGTVGEVRERKLMEDLLALCKENGVGRVSQVASQIEQIWRDPGKKEKFQKQKDKQVEFLLENIEQGLYDD
jgi:hypothetical protein